MVRTTENPWAATSADIHRTIRHHLEDGTDSIVATVVDIDGSGYRRPGAKMIVGSDGESQGGITAGCLEGPVVNAASTVLETDQPQIETYDLTDDDEDVWGLGLGCSGIIDVFLEPLDASFEPIVEAIDENRATTTLTAVESNDPDVDIGARTVVTADSRVSASRNELPDTVVNEGLERFDDMPDDKSVTFELSNGQGSIRVFVDKFEPAPELVIFGGQEDVVPVTSLASQAGFQVRVATARSGRADTDRFPAADEVVSIHPTKLADLIETPEYTYGVIMSHNFLDDSLALDSLLETEVPYIGLMGPQKRFKKLRKEMERDFDSSDLNRIATPVGLDLGGDEPSAIGFSIVSELLAVHNGHDGDRLSDRGGPIHERPDV